jgi:signal transduction histidine kinase
MTFQVLADKNILPEVARKKILNAPKQTGVFNTGITPVNWWMKVNFQASDTLERYYLKLNNPHINKLEVYLSDLNSPTWITGDHFPFHNRPYWDKDFVIPLGNLSSQPRSILLNISKPGETLLIAPMILTESQLLQKKSIETLIIGLFIGWMGVMLVGACMYTVALKDSSGIFYALFIFFLVLWLTSHWGIGYQYWWPNNHAWADKSRPVFNLLTNMFFLLLMMNFFPPLGKKNWLVYLLYSVIILHLLLVLDASLRPMSTIKIANKMAFLKITFGFSLLVTILIILYLWQQYRAKIQYAAYYLAGISFLIGFNLLVHLHQAGIPLIFNQFLFDFGSSFGMLGESLFITAAFIGKAADFKKERDKLELELVEKEKKVAERLIDVQENERNRLARDLHDSIGGMLASIYLKANQIESYFENHKLTDELKTMVSKSIIEARSISHNLTPPHLEETGLEDALRFHLKTIQEQALLTISFSFLVSSTIPKNLQLTLYRICCELIQNVLKHAQATELSIQILEHEKKIELIVEDDGVGFKTLSTKNGIGLKNIQDRISYWKGEFHIDSTTDGTTILIHIPLYE